jgi:prepilin-type N-terminal cleavage/methylation domain-containing protein
MTIDMRKSKANSNTRRTRGGFSAIELLITAAILSVVTSVGVMGISRARASIRLSGAAREYASYVEKARIYSIRSHADDAGERATLTINDDKASYTVTMDLDGDGVLDTRTITLPDGVTFDRAETIAFDWRGRTWSTANGVTTSNTQVSIVLVGNNDSVSIDITGSGDVTIDSAVFDDDVPDVKLHVADLTGATPTPTPITDSTATPTPTPDPVASPDNRSNPTPTPTPIGGGGDTTPTPTPTPTPTSTPTPTPTPHATPTPRATPTPEPAICTLSLSLPQLTLLKDKSGDIVVAHDAGTTLTVTASSSKASEIQVTPNSQTVAGGGSATFTIKSKKSTGIFSVTLSTSCGSKTIPVIVVEKLTDLL